MISMLRRAGEGDDAFRDLALTAMLATQAFALFFAAPLAALGHDAMRTATELLLVAYVLLVLLVTRNPTMWRIAIIVTVGGLGARLANGLITSASTSLVTHCVSILACIVLGYVVAGAVFAPGRVTGRRILGAIVIYLNIALSFSAAYRLVTDMVPDAFTNLPDGAEGSQSYAAIIYFSFVTLTSTGYGDILPVNPFARSLANLEAVIGQLYPATLLASLVARHLDTMRR